MDWIEASNRAAACLHGAQAVVVIVLMAWLDSRPSSTNKPGGNPFSNGGRFPVSRFVPVWDAQQPQPRIEALDAGVFDVRAAILVFFVLSCAFHAVAALFWAGRLGAVLHFVEYSLSASVAVVAIAVEAGVRDVYTLQAQFVLVFATMLLGIAAELTQQTQRQQQQLLPLLFHLAGWATCLSAYAPIMDTYLNSARLSALKPPAFVSALVFTEFALFACFGFVQAYALWARQRVFSLSEESRQIMRLSLRDNDDDDNGGGGGFFFPHDAQTMREIDERVEGWFIFLSLTAKTVLCWIVLSPLLLAAAAA